MIRVGILFEYGSLNGGEHSMLAALDELSRRDVALEVIAFVPAEGPLTSALRDRGIRVIPLEWKQHSFEEIVALLNEAVVKHKLDLLHANSLSMGRKLGKVAGQLAVPTSSHIRDIMKLNKSAVADLNQHRRLFAVSDATRIYHEQQGVKAARITTLYNGVDTEKFQPREQAGGLKRELSLPEEAILATTIGQICLRKGQLDLAKAAVLLKDQYPQLHYLLIGERHSKKAESVEFDEQITETFRQAGIEGRLHRLGYREDIAHILNEVDLLIHPARQEPLGRVLLEAASTGTPIVSTNVGGTPEILTHEVSAVLVEPNSPQELAIRIEQLLTQPERALEMSQQARLHIEELFSVSLSGMKLYEAWSGLLK